MNLNRTFLVGISGVARSGKDTVAAALVELARAKGVLALRYALADRLKDEIDPFCKEHYGTSAFTKDAAQKEIIRPFMVAHGEIKRAQTNGQYWWSNLDAEIAQDTADYTAPCIIVVPDVRYNAAERDEVWWIKQKRQGMLVHVARWVPSRDGWLPPANEVELRNDGPVKDAADVHLGLITQASPEGVAKETASRAELLWAAIEKRLGV